ncbi:ATPase with role in protein import into the ER [Ceratobasidium sp. UAMH 11750]|nr:ATPase with role in protein import into the ER [Ceratobasidium sp. UAMH 11750]
MHIIRLLTLVCALASKTLSSPTHNTPEYGTVIGIDLGTTYSCVGVYQGGRVEIIPNEQGNRITPSWVGFTKNERFIGDTAKQIFHTIPSQTIFDAKRLLGRHYEDIQLREDIQRWPFKVVNRHGRPAVEVTFQGSTRIFTPQEISAMILSRLKETAEAYLGRRVTHAVITVPAYFNDEQRQATKDAGQIAGLNVLRMINEPTAAAIAYGLDKKGGNESRMIVYDLGGGTFDVSLLRVSNGVFEVLATAGDTHLGGEDFDNRVIDYFVSRYQQETGTSILKNRRTMSKLKREVEKAKRTLSSQLTSRLEIESFEGGNDFSSILTRAKFEELNLDLFKRTLDPVTKVLQDGHLSPKDVDDVVLVGGSTRIPAIRQLLKDYFQGLEPRMGINPDEAVAYGAAIHAGILAGITPFDDVLLIDVCPFTLGIKTSGGLFSQLIARNTPIPTQKSEIFSTATDNQRTVLIEVLQGDSTMAKENYVLGTFKLTRIPPSVRGVPQIKVTFDVDANGILTVIAHDKDSGNSESIVITSEKNQLARSNVNQMAHEAQAFAQKDQESWARSIALNELQEQARRMSFMTKLLANHVLGAETQDATTRARLDHHSHWAESSGGLAGLAEISRRTEEVSQICTDCEGLIIKSDKIISSPGAAPSDGSLVLDARDMPPESTETLAIPISATSSPSVPIFRNEL